MGLGAAYLILRALFGPLLPFLIGFAVAAALRPAAVRLGSALRIKNGAAATAVTVLLYILLGGAAAGALWLAAGKLWGALSRFPEFFETTLAPAAERAARWLEERLAALSPGLAEQLSDITDGIISSLGEGVAVGPLGITAALSAAGAALPGAVVAALFAVLSSLFIGADYRGVTAFLLRQVPPKYRRLPGKIKKNILGATAKMFKSYFILMAVTFAELTAALWLLRVGNPAGVALAIAFADFLPVIGTGAVMVPWILAVLILGNWPLAAGLGISYAIISVVRGWLEPKVIGRQAGLHPLAALVSVYAGGVLFGAAGVVILPILVTAVKNLHDEGAVKLWK